MESSDEIGLFIIDNDAEYGQLLKHALEKEFDERVDIRLFPDGESCVHQIKGDGKNNAFVVLDFFGNRQPEIKDKSTIDGVTKIEPQQGIIIISIKKYIEKSIKGPVHSTHDQVTNDAFLFDFIVNSVKRCLNVPRI